MPEKSTEDENSRKKLTWIGDKKRKKAKGKRQK
jgi:hypothetical protein